MFSEQLKHPRPFFLPKWAKKNEAVKLRSKYDTCNSANRGYIKIKLFIPNLLERVVQPLWTVQIKIKKGSVKC